MADKLHFSLVSPERELFSGEVDNVTVPGSEGDFGVYPEHMPVMTTIRPGAISVINGDKERRIYILGGFADVTSAGLTILAEEAVELADIDPAKLAQDITDSQEDVRDAKTEQKCACAQERLDYLLSIQDAINA
ncbi:ATP synthase epsilon chain [hydrothermal vent metagenome]|uniref:ATP synthase epsilon chain n=1 Tax=hydrothermal vent metagenome TaxID=652676 RepID=A0A3B0RUX8_9ZZZZ